MSIESRSRQYGKVFDHWQIREFLGGGSGGKSAVFRLVHTESSTVFSALKIISLIERRGKFESLSDSRRDEYERAKKKCKENAEQEVLLMNGLQGQSNVVGYLDHTFIDWEDETGYGYDMLIRMELLKDLRSQLEEEHHFFQDEVLKIGRDICNALVLCHHKEFYHRDIKPENIFYNKDGNYKLGDFGISKIMSATPGAKSSTRAYTEEYAAPEQIFGRYDNRVDIYSLGLVLYELSNNGLLPFASSPYITEIETQERLIGKPIPYPKNASKDFAAVILKACAHNPDDRYQTAEEFLAELNYLAGVGPRPEKKVAPVGRGTQKATPAVDGYATQYAVSDTRRKTGGRETVYADPRPTGNVSYQSSRKDRPKVPKAAIIGIVLVIIFAIGAVAIWGIGAVADREAIAEIIDEADALANVENYDGAIEKVKEGLDKYPNSDELDDKLAALTGSQTDFEITAIIAEAEELASSADYDGAIAKLEAGLALYPDSPSLQNKVTEYAGVLAEEVKAQTLAEAKSLADAREYGSAMSMIKAAQEAYGNNKEYDEAYAVYHKAYSLEEAKVFADNGDYASAITLLTNAQTINANDVDIISAYNGYCDIYVADVLSNADDLYNNRQMNSAISLLDDALKLLPSNQSLEGKRNELNAKKPVSLSTIDFFNGGWDWNNLTPTDPFGNDYSSACNYVIFSDYYGNILPQAGFLSREVEGYRQVFAEYNVAGKYNALSMQIAPYTEICQNGEAFVQVYADSELVYTSPTVTRKSDAFTCEVDISGSEYIEILVSVYIGGVIDGGDEGAIIIADAQFWP